MSDAGCTDASRARQPLFRMRENNFPRPPLPPGGGGFLPRGDVDSQTSFTLGPAPRRKRPSGDRQGAFRPCIRVEIGRDGPGSGKTQSSVSNANRDAHFAHRAEPRFIYKTHFRQRRCRDFCSDRSSDRRFAKNINKTTIFETFETLPNNEQRTFGISYDQLICTRIKNFLLPRIPYISTVGKWRSSFSFWPRIIPTTLNITFTPSLPTMYILPISHQIPCMISTEIKHIKHPVPKAPLKLIQHGQNDKLK